MKKQYLPHKHAPTPETLSEHLGISLTQAEIVRKVIKSESRENLLSQANFPITSQMSGDASPLSVVLSAINETINGNGIKEIPFESRRGKGAFFHVALESESATSIGFNDQNCHFYLRSEEHVKSYGERHSVIATNEPSL